MSYSWVDSSNLILGYTREPLSKIQAELKPLPQQNPHPGRLSFMGEITRTKRNIMYSDGGRQFSDERFDSEHYPVDAPVCDSYMPTFSRLIGRGPIVKTK
jgi:hypothetical protein